MGGAVEIEALPTYSGSPSIARDAISADSYAERSGVTDINPINEANIEEMIDRAEAQCASLLGQWRNATNPDLRLAILAQYRLAAAYLDFLHTPEATMTEEDFDEPLTPAFCETRPALPAGGGGGVKTPAIRATASPG
jgi:hypothetical protein